MESGNYAGMVKFNRKKEGNQTCSETYGPGLEEYVFISKVAV